MTLRFVSLMRPIHLVGDAPETVITFVVGSNRVNMPLGISNRQTIYKFLILWFPWPKLIDAARIFLIHGHDFLDLEDLMIWQLVAELALQSINYLVINAVIVLFLGLEMELWLRRVDGALGLNTLRAPIYRFEDTGIVILGRMRRITLSLKLDEFIFAFDEAFFEVLRIALFFGHLA